MLPFPTPGLGEKIIELLMKGPHKTSDLVSTLQINTKTTIQGIYKSIRALREDGIVLMQKKEAVLNQAWLRQLEKFVILTEHAYKTPTGDSGHFLQMQDGDRITYTFKDPLQVDTFWNHVLYVLFDAFPQNHKWYAYASHCWFLLARRKEELHLKNHMNERNILYLFTVGHKTPLDKVISKDFDGIKSKYNMLDKPLFSQKPNHLGMVLNVFGDYIIEAQYDRNTTNKIEEFYRDHTTFGPDAKLALEQIVSSPSHIKFRIIRSKAKANKLAKILGKNFYFLNS